MTAITHNPMSNRRHGSQDAPANGVRPGAPSARRGFDSAKGLAVMLLAAIVSAMLVVADQLMSTWVEGHLLAAWVALWAVGFAAIALLSGTVRRFSAGVVVELDRWSARLAQKRADERLWMIARQDSRVMADLQSAMSRADEMPAIAVKKVKVPAVPTPAGRRIPPAYL